MRYRQLAEEQEESIHMDARRDIATRLANVQFASSLLTATGGGAGFAVSELGLLAGVSRHLANPREAAPFPKLNLVAPMLDYLDETDFPRKQPIISDTSKGAVEGRNGAINQNRPLPTDLPPR
jgi:hypothetical protein